MKKQSKNISFRQRVKNVCQSITIDHVILCLSVLALFGASLFIGYHSAIANQFNADTVADNYMFMDVTGPHQVVAPGTHTYLLKWPLFLLHNAWGFTLGSYIAICMGLSAITYLGFLFFTYKVAPSKKIVSLIALLLTAIILLTKPFASTDSFSLVNIAMPTIRNIEYLLYFGFLALLVRATWRNRYFWLAIPLFAILTASDPFFLYLGCAASVGLVALRYAKPSQITGTLPEMSMLAATLTGAILGRLIIIGINAWGIVEVSSFKISPLPFTPSMHALWDNILGTINGTLVNFGGAFFGEPAAIVSLPIVLNTLVAIAAVAATVHLVRHAPQEKPLFLKRPQPSQLRTRFMYASLFSAITAYAAFIVSSHDGVAFVGGIRYLYIGVFVGLLALAYILYRQNVQLTKGFYSAALIVAITICAGLPTAKIQQLRAVDDQQRLMGVTAETALKELEQRQISVVAGSFWSIFPMRFIGENKTPHYQLTVAPIEKCALAKNYFINKQWYTPSESVTNSALYLALDGKEPNSYDGCPAAELERIYGKPAEIITLPQDDAGRDLGVIWRYNYDIRTRITFPENDTDIVK